MGKSSLKGVGGWLLFLCIILTIISPLTTAINISRFISQSEEINSELLGNSSWDSFKIALWVVGVIKSVIGFSAGYGLGVLKPFSVRYAIWAIWISGPILALLECAVLFGIAKGHLTFDLNQYIISTLPNHIVFALVWSLYLKYSKRVRNTYYNVFPDASEKSEKA